MSSANKFLVSIVLFFISSTVYSQQKAVVSGLITDGTGPVPGVSVMLKSGKIGSVTNIDGRYQLKDITPGRYTLLISSIGYTSQTAEISLSAGQNLTVNLVLSASLSTLEDVTVAGKTRGREIKESGFSVNAIDTRQYANTTADLNMVLNRSTGVRIREQGGLGSSFNFSINGLSGKAVKYFIDGIPLEVMGSAMSLNNIPVNLAERIEVYKGVVPVTLGADAMGGAVDIITEQRPNSYLDISHSYGSFNTNRTSFSGQVVHKKTGLVVKASAFYNYSDNDYKMRGVEVLEGGERNGDEIINSNGADFATADVRRFHDSFQSAMGQLEAGFKNKKWADVLFLGVAYSEGKQDLQTGFEQKIVYGKVNRKSDAFNASVRYKKDDIFVKGLNFNLFASRSKDDYVTADTVSRLYYWDGSWEKRSFTEMGGVRTLGNIIRPRTFARANLSYEIGQNNFLNFNYTNDHLKNESYNELIDDGDDIPGLLDKQITGFAYQQKLFKKKLVTSYFAKYYRLGLEQRKYISGNYVKTDTAFSNYGYGIATRYMLLHELGLKASFEHAYRLQEAEEMFGDGLNVVANTELKPESSDNINAGAYYSFAVNKHRFFIEAAGFYRNASDFIYPVPYERSNAIRNENKSSVRITGFESELKYSYGSLLNFSVNGTYQNSVNTTKYTREGSVIPEATYLNKIPNQPWFFGNADLTIGKNDVLGKDTRLQFNWYTQYVHWFYLTWEDYGNVNGKSTIPNQVVHNASLSYSLKSGKYNVSVESRNLTNSLAYDNFRLQKPGRAFSVKLRYFMK